MSILQRAVTFTALSLGILALAGTSTPGWAFQTENTHNAAAAGSVPASVPASPASGVPLNDSTSVSPLAQTLPGHEQPASSSATPAAVVAQPDATPTLSYASLSDAIDAQDVPDDASDDLTCLAGAIYFESKGEPLAGQLAVADVIINRTKSGRFPASVCSVVKQRGQFSFVRNGAIPQIDNNRHYRVALAVAQVALADAWDSPAGNALYFHARSSSPSFRATRIASIGNHVFYR